MQTSINYDYNIYICLLLEAAMSRIKKDKYVQKSEAEEIRRTNEH